MNHSTILLNFRCGTGETLIYFSAPFRLQVCGSDQDDGESPLHLKNCRCGVYPVYDSMSLSRVICRLLVEKGLLLKDTIKFVC